MDTAFKTTISSTSLLPIALFQKIEIDNRLHKNWTLKYSAQEQKVAIEV